MALISWSCLYHPGYRELESASREKNNFGAGGGVLVEYSEWIELEMNSTDLECETPLQTSCRNAKLKNETSSETKPIIIGATIGALFICVLTCALIVFCKRRKSKKF